MKRKYLSMKLHGIPGEAQKLSVFACNQNPVEIDKTPKPKEETAEAESAAQKTKFKQAISRAKGNIKELVLNNHWQGFFTGTVSPEKFDRKDYRTIEKALRTWLNNFKKRYADELQYLLVPEMHADGSWHFHGFFSGIPMRYFEQFKEGMQMSSYLARKVKQGKEIFNFPAYAKRFGFCDFEPIEDKEKCASYVAKYITKNLESTAAVLDSGAHLFFASKGLNRCKRVVAEDVPEFAVEHLANLARDGRVYETDFGFGFDISIPADCDAEEYVRDILDGYGISVEFNKSIPWDELLADAPW